MLIQVAQNTASGSINGQYYGTILVDTGINNAIIATGTGASFNSALTFIRHPTYITIGLPGSAASSQSGQYTYVFQGICPVNPPNYVGCGPP